MSEKSQTTNDGISRRTVTKAMAWAVPAIAVAAPIPAFAASGAKPTIVTGNACKSPGGSCKTFKFGYVVPVTITNSSNKTIWITSLDLTKNTTGIPLEAEPVPALPWEIGPNGGTFTGFFLARSTNSANATGTIAFAAGWGHAASGDLDHLGDPIVSGDIVIEGTPPTCVCV